MAMQTLEPGPSRMHNGNSIQSTPKPLGQPTTTTISYTTGDMGDFMPSETAPPCSAKTFHIAGILTTVYGLEELPPSCNTISCLWLLHARLASKEQMAPVAADVINDWNKTLENSSTSGPKKGLIAVSFDQRNHGSREANKLANEAWNFGNPRHAQDMFSIIQGTAVDTTILIDHLTSYVFSEVGDPPVEQHLVMGISLGGHAAWQVIFDEPRITAAVIVIGCPDYQRVMTDRARLSKLPTYTTTSGASFIGSKDFPLALVKAVHKRDPKGIIFGDSEITAHPTLSQQIPLRKGLDATIKGKRLLVVSGKSDKLVPYHCSAPFLDFLKNATAEGGWYADGGVYVEDNVYEGVGHAYSEGMRVDALRFVRETLLAGSFVDGENKGSRL